jgi:acyl-CoA synthetase (AMP-forming)/AMP-acid ligase II
MVPYGATEALPVANLAGSEITAETAEKMKNGRGYCVGKPLAGIDIYVVSPADGPIDTWDDSLKLPAGETGEIVIDGDVVTPEYYNLPEYTKSAKIAKKSGKVMHRMGDMGYFDDAGYLWFKGRKAHIVTSPEGPLYPVCCEAVFNTHPWVSRSALVGVGEAGKQIPVLVVEPAEKLLPLNQTTRDKLISELRKKATENDLTAGIKKFLLYTPFPVDIRHNAKISREKLAQWAEKIDLDRA